MHHHRIRLEGPPDAVRVASHALRARGITGGELDFTFAAEVPLDGIRALSASYPDVVVLVTAFEVAGADVEEIALRAGMVTARHQQPVLETIPAAARLPWGRGSDADGEPLDAEALRAAARAVAGHPDFGRWHATTFLGRALLLGEALGALCCMSRDAVPSPATLDAVIWLATRAACAGVRSERELGEPEMAFECAWRLTRSAALAAEEDLWEEPWSMWVALLVGMASDAVADLSEADAVALPDGVSRWGSVPDVDEDGRVLLPHVYGEASTSALLSTCLQVLAQFDARLEVAV